MSGFYLQARLRPLTGRSCLQAFVGLEKSTSASSTIWTHPSPAFFDHTRRLYPTISNELHTLGASLMHWPQQRCQMDIGAYSGPCMFTRNRARPPKLSTGFTNIAAASTG